MTGNNVVYKRRVLARHHEVIDEHKWENRLHDAIRAGGTALVCHPEVIVDHKKHFTISEYLNARYQYSRSYAGARVDGQSNVRRGVYALATLALPSVQEWVHASQNEGLSLDFVDKLQKGDMILG